MPAIIPISLSYYENGRLDVYSDNEKSALDLLDDGALQSWSFGPILVEAEK